MFNYNKFRKNIAKKLYDLNPIVTDSNIVAITGVTGCGKTDYATSYISTLGKEVIELNCSTDINNIKKDCVVWVDELDLFSSKFQKEALEKVKEVGANFVFTYLDEVSAYADICDSVLDSAEKFVVPKLSIDAIKIISNELGKGITISSDFDGNVRKLVLASSNNFKLYGIVNTETNKLVSDITSPRHKFWEKKAYVESSLMRCRSSKYNRDNLKVVTISCGIVDANYNN